MGDSEPRQLFLDPVWYMPSDDDIPDPVELGKPVHSVDKSKSFIPYTSIPLR